MSLTVVVNGPEGIVLTADTRVTVPYQSPSGGVATVSYDNATKVLSFGDDHPWVGAVTYGLASIAGRTAHSLMPEIEVQLDGEYTVAEYAQRLSDFFMARWNEAGYSVTDPPGGGMSFMVAGYDLTKPYGEVWAFAIPTITRAYTPPGFRAFWGGQTHLASRIVNGIDPRLGAALQERFGLSDEQRRMSCATGRAGSNYR